MCLGSVNISPDLLIDLSVSGPFLPYLSNSYNVSARLSCVQSFERMVSHCKVQDLNLGRWNDMIKTLGSAVRMLRLGASYVSIFAEMP